MAKSDWIGNLSCELYNPQSREFKLEVLHLFLALNTSLLFSKVTDILKIAVGKSFFFCAGKKKRVTNRLRSGMSRKFLEWLKRPEWLTPPVMMAMVSFNVYLSQNHFVNSPFSKLMQQQGLEKEISTLNTLLAGVSILAALVTMINRGSWVKPVIMVASVGNAMMMLIYPWALSLPDPTTLYVIRCIQILLDSVIYGGLGSLLRMVASEERTAHKKTMALNEALTAAATSIAKILGFWLIANPMTWAVCGSLLNLLTILLVWMVDLGEKCKKTEERNLQDKRRVPSGRRQWFIVVRSESSLWALAFGRLIPTIGNNFVFMLIGGGGYFPLFIHETWLAGAALTAFAIACLAGKWISACIPKGWDERGIIAVASVLSIGEFQCLYWVDVEHVYFILIASLFGITYGTASNSYGFLMNRLTVKESLLDQQIYSFR
jgi:hypothetical protein